MKKAGDVVKLGVAAGAALAATKVAEKYNELKEETGGDINGDGVVDVKDTIDGIKIAAKDVIDKATAKANEIKEKVQDPNFVNEAKETITKTAGEVMDDFKEAAEDVKATAGTVIDDVKESADDFIDDAKDAAGKILG